MPGDRRQGGRGCERKWLACRGGPHPGKRCRPGRPGAGSLRLTGAMQACRRRRFHQPVQPHRPAGPPCLSVSNHLWKLVSPAHAEQTLSLHSRRSMEAAAKVGQGPLRRSRQVQDAEPGTEHGTTRKQQNHHARVRRTGSRTSCSVAASSWAQAAAIASGPCSRAAARQLSGWERKCCRAATCTQRQEEGMAGGELAVMKRQSAAGEQRRGCAQHMYTLIGIGHRRDRLRRRDSSRQSCRAGRRSAP